MLLWALLLFCFEFVLQGVLAAVRPGHARGGEPEQAPMLAKEQAESSQNQLP